VVGGPKGAAAKLGLKRTTLLHRMRKLGIRRTEIQDANNVSVQQPKEEEANVPQQLRSSQGLGEEIR